jgi:alpha-amylase
LLKVRRENAWGEQLNYFDHWNRVGWTRLGDDQHPKALAVMMSDGPGGTKWMNVARPNAVFDDVTGTMKEPVYTNGDGWGEFRCEGGSVSVWVQR